METTKKWNRAVDFKQITVSGKIRHYYKPLSMNYTIKPLKNFMLSPEYYKNFINHVVLNHKGLNWKTYRYKLTQNNYKTFIYAFAFTICSYKPTSPAAWQLETNARQLRKSIFRNRILLTVTERNLIDCCIHFTNSEMYSKNYFVQILSDLKKQYSLGICE